jgi:acyl-CoA thioesterase-1
MASRTEVGGHPQSGCRGRREFLIALGLGAWFASASANPARGAEATPPSLQAPTGRSSGKGATPRAQRILVFGDSLSAGYGMAREQAWPSLLAEQLAHSGSGTEWEVINASVSGETTHGGLNRLGPALLRFAPAVVILELGGNDALRGTPLGETRRNLDELARQIGAQGARLLIVGVALPPNFGEDYTRDFAALFELTARRHKAALVPNLVEALGSSREAFQADGIHPLASAQPRLLATVMGRLDALLKPHPGP